MSEMLYSRDAYGEALIELGQKNKEETRCTTGRCQMPEINIQSADDIKKLTGCHIHSAKAALEGPIAYLELEVSHILIPKIVRIRIHPYSSFTIDTGRAVFVAGLSYQTEDVEEEP